MNTQGFEGFRRPDDAIGVRNHVLVLFVTGLVASNAQIVLFTTGVSNRYVSALAPTIKISGNPATSGRLREQLDFDASSVFKRRESLESAAERLQQLLQARISIIAR